MSDDKMGLVKNVLETKKKKKRSLVLKDNLALGGFLAPHKTDYIKMLCIFYRAKKS